MSNKRKKARSRRGLQVVTLCISTTMVLLLLGMVVFFVLSARNLSAHMKENLTMTIMLQDSVSVAPILVILTISARNRHSVSRSRSWAVTLRSSWASIHSLPLWRFV